MEDFYKILGIPSNASQEDIKKAFYRLARQFHPDVAGPDHDTYFKKITESYQILSDPDQRRHYDIKRIVNQTATSKIPVKEVVDVAFQGFSEFLNDLLFKEGEKIPNIPVKGQDVETSVHIRFDESYLGCQKIIQFKSPRICSDCKGKGWPPKNPPEKCPECRGAKVRLAKGPIPFKRSCKRCGGKGQIQNHVCSRCNGTCLFAETDSTEIKIPAGVDNETRLCLAKKGGSGLHGGDRGDLIINITVETDPNFERQGNDLKVHAPITISELLLGTKIQVLLPGDSILMRVPPGADLNQAFRLKNKGFPIVKKEESGDLYVHLKLVLPPKVPDSAVPLLKQLANLIPGF